MPDAVMNSVARPANNAENDHKLTTVCIREDGMLVHANATIIKNSTGALLPYDGPMDAPLEDRLMYFRGFRKQIGGTAAELVEAGRLDITRMSIADLKEYALDEYGLDLSDKKIGRSEALMKVIEAREGRERPKNGQPVAAAQTGIK